MKETKESYIKLKTEITTNVYKDKTVYVGRITESEEFTGIICQSSVSEEDLERHLIISLKAMLRFHEDNFQKLQRLAIFQSNKSDRQFWFRILGIGLTINTIKRDSKFQPIIVKGWKYLGLTRIQKTGLVIGNKLIFFSNAWNN